MKFRFIMLVLLALLMTAGFVGAVSADDIITIDGIYINTTINPPVTFEKSVTGSVNCTNGSATASISWSPSLSDGKFEVGKEYTATITVTAISGYNFTHVDKLRVDGSGEWSAKMNTDNTTITATKKFDKTTPALITSFRVFDNNYRPIAGNIPNITAPTINGTGVNENDVGRIYWKKGDDDLIGNFTYSTIYNAQFKVNALNGYKFTRNTDVDASIGTATILPDLDGTSATVTITYSETARDPSIKLNITNVAVTDIDIPAAGATPDTNAAVISTPGDSVVTPPGVSWGSVSTFENGKNYTVNVTAQAASGYQFIISSITATINGKQATISQSSTNSTLIFSCTYTATPVVSTVYLTITAPSTGNTPDTKVKSNTTGVNANSSSVSWYPDDTKFVAGKEYEATIKVPASSGYTFSSSPTVYLNGDKVGSVSIDSDGKLTFDYDFSNKISKIYLTIAEPKTGNKPSETVSGDYVNTVNSVTWSPNDSTFAEGTTYTVKINFDLKDLEYTESPTFYINNVEASKKEIDSNTYEVERTFSTESLISKISVVLNPPVTRGSAPTSANIQSYPYNAVTEKVSWSPSASTFAGDTQYTANIEVKTYDGYLFSSTVTATVNGDTARVTRNSDSTVTVSYTYPKTAVDTSATVYQTSVPKSNDETNNNNTNTTSFIPNPINIIQEFVKLFLSLFNFDNYVIFGNNTTAPSA